MKQESAKRISLLESIAAGTKRKLEISNANRQLLQDRIKFEVNQLTLPEIVAAALRDKPLVGKITADAIQIENR